MATFIIGTVVIGTMVLCAVHLLKKKPESCAGCSGCHHTNKACSETKGQHCDN